MEKEIRLVLARNVRRLRRGRGWSQEQLADRCGLHRTYVGAVERGERNLSLDSMARLAAALDTDVAALLTLPWGVEERLAAYGFGRRPGRRSYPCGRRTAVHVRQSATYRLSTPWSKAPVMGAHDRIGKEATRPAHTPAADQPRLVTGSAG